MIIKNYIYGRKALLKGQVALDGGNIKAQLVKVGSSFMVDDPTTMAGFVTLGAFTGAAIITLSGGTVTEDLARDRVIFTATRPSWVALANDTDPIIGLIIYQGGVNIPLYGYKLTSPVNPNGTTYEFPLSAAGISEI